MSEGTERIVIEGNEVVSRLLDILVDQMETGREIAIESEGIANVVRESVQAELGKRFGNKIVPLSVSGKPFSEDLKQSVSWVLSSECTAGEQRRADYSHGVWNGKRPPNENEVYSTQNCWATTIAGKTINSIGMEVRDRWESEELGSDKVVAWAPWNNGTEPSDYFPF